MKLVIYNKENSQPVGQRNGERTLRFNRENGMIYISKSFAAELGIGKSSVTLLKKKAYVLCTIKSVEDTQYKIEDCRPGESDLPF